MSKAVYLLSKEGDLFELSQTVIQMCSTVMNMLSGRTSFKNSLGGEFAVQGSLVVLKKENRVLASLTKNDEREAYLSLPEVTSATLEKLLEFCTFHSNEDLSEKQRKQFDNDFIQLKQSILCELASVRMKN